MFTICSSVPFSAYEAMEAFLSHARDRNNSSSSECAHDWMETHKQTTKKRTNHPPTLGAHSSLSGPQYADDEASHAPTCLARPVPHYSHTLLQLCPVYPQFQHTLPSPFPLSLWPVPPLLPPFLNLHSLPPRLTSLPPLPTLYTSSFPQVSIPSLHTGCTAVAAAMSSPSFCPS